MNAPASRVSIADRYQILGRLGTGGMAEVHLAKTIGPAGFEKLVVIKRMLSHLQSDPAHIAMFLDEARIVARIQHRNVVQVHDLHESDEGYLLVMEYLEGETASMYQQQVKPADPWLAAFVVAEAAQGLHAAHELKRPDGSSYNVVHRDVSPQNVFITYAGDVKLLDFGVARAEDRHTRTESGVVKGKFAYMAPEQFLDRSTIDRRADVFALGTLLYELSTGTSLFDQGGVLEIIRAVCTQPIVPPSSKFPGYPRELDAICLKALQRNRDSRYLTADEMARDLMRAMSSVEPTGMLRDRLSAVMMERFKARRDRKRALIERGDSARHDAAFDSGADRLAAGALSTPRTDTSLPQPASPPVQPSSTFTVERALLYPPARAVVLALAAMALFFGIGAGVYVVVSAFFSSATLASSASPIADESLAPSAAVPRQTVDAPPVAASGEASSRGEAPAPSPLRVNAPEPPLLVAIRVETSPSPIAVSAAGQRCLSPCVLSVPESEQPLQVVGTLPSGELFETQVVPSADQTVHLQPADPAARGEPAAPPETGQSASDETTSPRRPDRVSAARPPRNLGARHRGAGPTSTPRAPVATPSNPARRPTNTATTGGTGTTDTNETRSSRSVASGGSSSAGSVTSSSAPNSASSGSSSSGSSSSGSSSSGSASSGSSSGSSGSSPRSSPPSGGATTTRRFGIFN